MQNNELKIDWIDFFRFIWSKKILIIVVIFLGMIGGIHQSSDVIKYTVKLPYTNYYAWQTEDLINQTSGRWRSSIAKNLSLKPYKIKYLIDNNIHGFLIHETNKPKKVIEYIQELNSISKLFAAKGYQKELSVLRTYDAYSSEVKKTEYYAEKISGSVNLIKQYESGIDIAFQVHHPDLLPFLNKEIGIVSDKNQKLRTVVFYVFISFFILSLYLFITYLRKKT
tara:strand:+ start:822 stop:1493 length:672 start_codon:yes stop_codon:yes gene_type:complete